MIKLTVGYGGSYVMNPNTFDSYLCYLFYSNDGEDEYETFAESFIKTDGKKYRAKKIPVVFRGVTNEEIKKKDDQHFIKCGAIASFTKSTEVAKEFAVGKSTDWGDNFIGSNIKKTGYVVSYTPDSNEIILDCSDIDWDANIENMIKHKVIYEHDIVEKAYEYWVKEKEVIVKFKDPKRIAVKIKKI